MFLNKNKKKKMNLEVTNPSQTTYHFYVKKI